jgi:cation:H+ antiporter
MTILYLFLLILASFLLIKVTDRLILHLKNLDSRIKIGGFAITGIFLALATSLPELFVGITSALEGAQTVALGNVVGSNIANLSIVAGLAAFIGGTFKVENGSTKEDLLHAFVAGGAPLVLLYDKVLSRVDALILIALYGFYNYTILPKRRRGYEEEGVVSMLVRKLKPKKTRMELSLVFFYIILVLILADVIVRLSGAAAADLNIPVFLIGLFIVALGTSLPELAFELEAVRKGEASMFMGNLMGSLVANGTLIIGVTALIAPIHIGELSEYFLASVFFVVIFFLFYLFTRTEHKLERWEGGTLIFVYLLFLFLEIL